MNLNTFKYLFICALAIFLVGCKQSKYVGTDYYLLKDNVLYIEADSKDGSSKEWGAKHDILKEGELLELIRPTTNSGFKLFIYNRVDTTKQKRQVEKKKLKYSKKSEKRQVKEDKKNKKRIDKAKRKGKSHYKRKEKSQKTLRLGHRTWIVNHWGEAPVVVDTTKVTKSKQQLSIYLNQHGFKDAIISDSIVYIEKKKKATVNYYVIPNKPYRIASIAFETQRTNASLDNLYKRMLRKEGSDLAVGDILDEDQLNKERTHFTKYLKDNSFVGFTKNYLAFIVDTTLGNHQAAVTFYVKEKRIDSLTVIPHKTYLVDKVTFRLNNPDSSSFKDFGAFKRRCDALGLEHYNTKTGYALLDTMFIEDTIITKRYINFNKDVRKDNDLKLFQKFIDTNIYYKGYFIYNETPFVDPRLLDKQNFLEHSDLSRGEKHYAKDYYKQRSYQSLLRLNIFQRINPSMVVSPSNPNGRYVDIVYSLTPTKKQQFILEPRATNTNSILGVSGGISYTNKNLTKKANSLKFTVSGGFQSQPLIVGDGSEGTKVFQIRGLNTFEWGPEITYSLPRFFPLSKKAQEGISKRSFPSTDMSALYNYQSRTEFKRHIGEISYKWKFSSADLLQIFTVTPIRFNYVKIAKDTDFEQNLLLTNDPFLINSYSDFLSLGIMSLGHHYNNMKKKTAKRTTKHTFDNNFNLTASGLVVNSIKALTVDSLNYGDAFNLESKKLFLVPFAQFMKVENTFTLNQFLTKKHRLVYRFNGGFGYAYANGVSLPYTESFVAGGSNDIRAFAARTMAPGGTQTYKDSTSTSTQIGDMKLEFNLEWRFKMVGMLKGAIFVDMGNIWKVKGDAADPGLFTFGGFYKQVAIGTGFGLRADLEFLIVRLDMSWALHNPYLPAGNRWWLTADNTEYNSYFDIDPDNNKFINYTAPHGLRFNFGIGYPF